MGCEVSKPLQVTALVPNRNYNMVFITSDYTSDLESKDVISLNSSLHLVDA